MIIDVYPDMNLDFYAPAFENKSLRGLIIRTYGTGNAPDYPTTFIDELERLITKRNVVVLNITQCAEGNVELRLFETNARLFDIGVINGGDMTREAAYCKLKWLLGQRSLSVEQVKRDLQIDRRGELTFSAYSIAYVRSTDQETLMSPVFLGPSVDIGHFRFEPAEIDHAYVRIQGITVLDEVEKGSDFSVRIYYGRTDLEPVAAEDLTRRQIGHFSRRIERKGEYFSHNIEVTDGVRRLIRTSENHVALQSFAAGATVSFESLKLTIFTRR